MDKKELNSYNQVIDYDPKYKFNEAWFDPFAKIWNQLIDHTNCKFENSLEIGCYEGRASIWLANNHLKSGSNYTVLDTFGGTEIEDGMERTAENFKENTNFIEENFKHNISFHKDINWNIIKGYSQIELAKMKLEPTYDFIYIDGSHQADDTFVDGYYAHKLLKPGGLLIFDDYGWGLEDIEEKGMNWAPRVGIDAFLFMHQRSYQNLIPGQYQTYLYKIPPAK
jgi:predicted O-methyltransferase YrrM